MKSSRPPTFPLSDQDMLKFPTTPNRSRLGASIRGVPFSYWGTSLCHFHQVHPAGSRYQICLGMPLGRCLWPLRDTSLSHPHGALLDLAQLPP
jgi:hypothetical protein